MENLGLLARLLRTGQDGMIWSAIPTIGLSHIATIPLSLIGVLVLMGRKRSAGESLMLAWIGVSIALGTILAANANRMNVILIPMLFCAAVGIESLLRYRAATAIIAGTYALSFTLFLQGYMTQYREQASRTFHTGLVEAITEAAASTNGLVCVTDQVNMPYIYALFSQRTDPHTYLQTVRYLNPGAEFQAVSSFDRFVFGLQRCRSNGKAFVAIREEIPQFSLQDYEIRLHDNYAAIIPH